MIREISYVLIGWLWLSNVYAVNLGVHGQVYPIAEKDFLDLINERYLTMKENGEWRKAEEIWQKSMEQSDDRPRSLNIATTITARTYTFDPSIELKKDMLDASGNVLIKAGTTINPLTILPLTKALLFINADDKHQINWAKLKIQQSRSVPANAGIHSFKNTKLILVSGSISGTFEKIKVPIYFDQWGKLTHHFQIKHVPALIKQEGQLLVISEELP